MTDQMNEIVGHSENVLHSAYISSSKKLTQKNSTKRQNAFVKELQSLENITVAENSLLS